MKLLLTAAFALVAFSMPVAAVTAAPALASCDGVWCSSDGSARDTDRTWDRRQDNIDRDRHGRTINQDHDSTRMCTDYSYC